MLLRKQILTFRVFHKFSVKSAEIPFNLTVLHNESKTSIFTSERFGLFGTISKNKDIKFSIKKGKPLFFNLTGNLNGLELNFDIDDIYINVTVVNYTYYVLIGGAIVGFVAIYFIATRKMRRNKVR